MLLPLARKHRSSWYFYIFISVLVLVGCIASWYVYVQVDTAGREHVLDLSKTVAQAVSSEDIAMLSGTESDIENETYQKNKLLLMQVRSVNRDVRFIYLVGKDVHHDLFFYMDSEDSSSEDYSPPGQTYLEATDDMHALFRDGQARVEGPDQDRWGVWISGYAPIHDAEGNIVALLGIDLPANRFLLDNITYASLPLLTMLIILLITLMSENARKHERDVVDQKEEFLFIASHEIRTPLTGIRWALEGLLTSKSEPPSPSASKILSLMHANCLHLLTRINSLLDVTSVENRTTEAFHTEHIAVAPMLDEIIETLLLSAQERGIIIEHSVPPETKVLGDPQLIRHVFFNLLSNAVKYTASETAVTMTYKKLPHAHEFKIVDHGNGIREQDQQRIFSGYYRTKDAVRTTASGSGLGLYLTKRAVALHKGTIAIESKMGEGTTFIVTLPDKH